MKTANTRIPKTQLLTALINAELPERHITALGEFIDNALGEAAGNAKNVLIAYSKNMVLIADDGQGIENMDAMFTLGDSHSRLSSRDIGQFGYGAKVGALYLAWDMEVQTIFNKTYHVDRVDWHQVLKSGKWPNAYHGIGKPMSSAPVGFKKGTRISLRRRHPRRNWQGEALAQSLAHIYRPALLAGSKIILKQLIGKKSRVWDLTDYLGDLHLENRIKASGAIDGKTFKLRAGRVRNLSDKLNGIHVAFGHRFIVTEKRLIGRHIPAQLYAEVLLSPEWKSSLAANKSSLAHDRDELIQAVEQLLAPLIDELESEAQKIEIRGFVFELQQDTSALLDAVNEKAGTHGAGTSASRAYGEGEGYKKRKKKKYAKEVKTATNKGENGADQNAAVNKKMGVEVILESIGPRVTKISVTSNAVRITLNKDLLHMRLINKDVPVLIFTILNALTDACIENTAHAALIFPKFKTFCDAGETPFEAKQRLMHEMLLRQESTIH